MLGTQHVTNHMQVCEHAPLGFQWFQEKNLVIMSRVILP